VTQQINFDAVIRSWFDDTLQASEPDTLLHSVLTKTAVVRQRPGWVVRLTAEPMQAAGKRAWLPTRFAPAVLLLLLLTAALLGVLLVGALRTHDVGKPGLLAFTRYGEVYVATPDGARMVLVSPTGRHFSHPIWSPDGTRLAVQGLGDDGVYVLDPYTLALRRLGTGTFSAWSPDSRFVAVTDEVQPFLRLVDTATGTARTLSVPAPTFDQFVWSPDGRWLAGAVGGNLARVDIKSGAIKQLAVGGSGATWSPDSSRIAFVQARCGTCPASIAVVGVDGSRTTQITRAVAFSSNPVWSPDGTLIAYQVGRGSFESADGHASQMTTALSIALPDGGVGIRLVDTPVGQFAWSPDGESILFTRLHEFGEQFHDLWRVNISDRLVRSLGLTVADFAWQPLAANQPFPALPAGVPSTTPVP
jgi:WD40 repeat protein